MKNLSKSWSKPIRNSMPSRFVAIGAVLSSLLWGVAACSGEAGSASDGEQPQLARAAAAQQTTESVGVTEWVVQRVAGDRSMIIEGHDAAGHVVTMVEAHGSAHDVSMSVDSDLLEVNDAAGVLTDTLSPRSIEVITRVKADLEGTPAVEALLAARPSANGSRDVGSTAQAVATKPTTTVANCFACWLVTVGTGAEFCYKYGHCDN